MGTGPEDGGTVMTGTHPSWSQLLHSRSLHTKTTRGAILGQSGWASVPRELYWTCGPM